MTQNDIREAIASDDAFLRSVLAGCGMFSPEEVAELGAMLADQLADPEQVWLRSDGAAAYLTRDGLSRDVWNLWFIGTLQDARRQGQGGRLLDRAEAEVRRRDGRLLIIETSSDEAFDPARALYAGRGYAEQGRIADYYAPGEAKVIFARTLA